MISEENLSESQSHEIQDDRPLMDPTYFKIIDPIFVEGVVLVTGAGSGEVQATALSSCN